MSSDGRPGVSGSPVAYTTGDKLFDSITRPAVLAIALSLSGCANLGAIQEFGRMSADGASYTKLSDDYVQSPEYRKAFTFRADTAQRDHLTRVAEERKKQGAELEIYHRSVSAYMNALADLAGDEAPNFDPELDAMVDAAAQARYLTEEKAEAVRALGKAFTGALASTYQQRELKQVIEHANAPLQTMIASMTVIMEGFAESLNTEQAVFVSYHQTLIGMGEEKGQDGTMREPVAAQMAYANLELGKPAYAARARAIPRYIETLQKIGVAHQSLYDHRHRISDQEVLSQLARQTRQIRAAYIAVRAAG